MRCSLRMLVAESQPVRGQALAALPKADRLPPALRSRVNSKGCGDCGWATTAWSTNGSAATW